jgi:serine/threonine protein phosphatase PrpC
VLIPPEPPRLYVSHDTQFHWLVALEYGRVGEDQPPECWVLQSDTFAYLLDAPEGRVVGFRVNDFHTFDPEDPEVAAIWDEPRFDVPTLGLTNSTAGEIAIAARRRFGDTDSLNRRIFGLATGHQGEDALEHWQNCLESGDGMAHFALGYTLLELGRAQEAYGHLRHYTEIAPMGAWNWCWYGQAAEAVGELSEARRAYRRAIELDEDGEAGAGIDAAERLDGLPDVLGGHGVFRLSDAALMAQETASVADDFGPADADRDVDNDASGASASSADRDGGGDASPGAGDDAEVDDTDEVRFMSYDGRDYPEHSVRQLNGMDIHIAAGITAGAQPKAYPHTDPNEDALRVLRSGDATVLALCDGHRGESGARLAVQLLGTILGEDPHALDTEEDLLGTLHMANDYVRNETAAAGQPESRTTLALAVVKGGRVRWVHMGDSLLAIVEPDGEVRRLGKARHRFLGWPMDLADVDAATDRGTEHSAPAGWLVLASDGLTDFAKPWRAAVKAATQIDDVATLPPTTPTARTSAPSPSRSWTP